MIWAETPSNPLLKITDLQQVARIGKERGILIATETGESGGVRITVADHGHGVSRQLGDNIFHPFVTTKREGLGVGLAISRTITQSFGGSLTYRDNAGGGATFVVELPAAKEED